MPEPTPRNPDHDRAELPADQLLPLVYEELRAIAAVRMSDEKTGHTLQPTALVHEAWLKLNDGKRTWESRAHFYRAAALAMRRILIDHARQKATLKRAGGLERFDIAEIDFSDASAGEHLLLVDESLRRLEKDDPVRAEIVMLKFFSGLSNKETAATLGISEATVERRWALAKIRLFRIMQQLEKRE